MATNTVVVTMTAQDAQMVAAWQRAKQGPAAMAAELQKVGRASHQAGAVAKGTFQQLGSSLGGMAMAITGIGSAAAAAMKLIDLFKSEMEAMRARQGRFADQQVGEAQAFRRAGFALGAGADMSYSEMVAAVRGGRGSVDPSISGLVAESAISGAGTLGAKRAVETATAAMQLRPDLGMAGADPEGLRNITSGALELQKGFSEASPQQTTAAIHQLLSNARQEDVANFAKYVAPSISQARSFGGGKDRFEYLAGLALAIGQRSGDPTGRPGSTAFIKFSKQVQEAAIGGGLVPTGSTVEQSLEAIRGDTQKAQEIRSRLRGYMEAESGITFDDAMQKEARGELTGEARQLVALSELLDPKSTTTQMQKDIMGRQISLTDETVRAVDNLRKTMDRDPSQAALLMRQQQQGVLADIRTDPGVALAGMRREFIEQLSLDLGDPAMTARLRNYAAQATTPEDAVAATELSIADLEAAKEREKLNRTTPGKYSRYVSWLSGGPVYGAANELAIASGMYDRVPDAQSNQNIAKLDEAIAVFKEMLEVLKENKAATQAMRPTASPAPVSSPAKRLGR